MLHDISWYIYKRKRNSGLLKQAIWRSKTDGEGDKRRFKIQLVPREVQVIFIAALRLMDRRLEDIEHEHSSFRQRRRARYSNTGIIMYYIENESKTFAVSRRFTDDRDRRSGRFSPNERAFRQRRGERESHASTEFATLSLINKSIIPLGNGHSTESRRLRGCNENYFEKRSENGKKGTENHMISK